MTPEEIADQIMAELHHHTLGRARNRIAAAIREAEERGSTVALFRAPKATVSLEMVGDKRALRISIGRRTDYVPTSDIGLPPGHVLTPDGVVRKCLGELPLTADGCVMGNGAKVYAGRSARAWATLVLADEPPSSSIGSWYSMQESAEAASKAKQAPAHD